MYSVYYSIVIFETPKKKQWYFLIGIQKIPGKCLSNNAKIEKQINFMIASYE